MTDIIIREAQSEDTQACFETERLCFHPDEAASLEKIKKRIEIYPRGFLVAVLDRKIVGHVNCAATTKTDITDEDLKDMVGHEEQGENLIIFSLAVHPDFQGRGISSQLLKGFIAHAAYMNKEAIFLICKEKLIKYYEKYGFEFLGPSKSSHGGFRWFEMRLNI